jgi:hypothetical protein
MKIAIQGCCHGELDAIYTTCLYIQETQNIKIDLLLICGDVQVSTIICLRSHTFTPSINIDHEKYSRFI